MEARLMSGAPTTFVCCIEPGMLEPMTVRLLRSIRMHGGAFANARFIACQPRLGPPLAVETRRALQDLDGEHVWLWRPRPMDWYHYLNKAESLLRLDSKIHTEWVTFLDSDMLVAREPSELVSPDADFLACAPDDGIVGSTGPKHPMDPMWLRYIAAVGLQPTDVPMIQEFDTGKRIRLYFNSGAFSYRRSTGFATFYHGIVHQVLRLNLGFPYYGEHFTDQVVLGLCALKMGLKWSPLPYGYNLAVDRGRDALPDDKLAAATILHYHKALAGDAEPLLGRLRDTHPDLVRWLAPLGSLQDPRTLGVTTACELLRIARGAPRAIYRRRVERETKKTTKISS